MGFRVAGLQLMSTAWLMSPITEEGVQDEMGILSLVWGNYDVGPHPFCGLQKDAILEPMPQMYPFCLKDTLTLSHLTWSCGSWVIIHASFLYATL